MLFRPLFCVFLVGCAGLSAAKPEPELAIRGLSSAKNPQLAKDVAQARATARAGLVKSNVRFVLDRSRGKPMLKIVGEPTSTGLSPDFEPLKPAGQKAVIKMKRTAPELESLRKLDVTRVRIVASGLDLAVAHERADRTLFKEAILRFALAQQKNDPQLYGTLIIVNYDADAQGDSVTVTADVSVSFGAKNTLQPERAAVSVSEDQEEVPEEKVEITDEVLQTASQPTQGNK